ncbi:MAG: hypothetical protein R3359_12390 [Marinirhabdus sp.]|nr:hypothetical protein [Marinirhabdus sp.]
METDEVVDQVKDKFIWKWKYTVVLLLNAGYIMLFYFLMKNFT